MAKIVRSILETIGNTPLMELNVDGTRVFAKLEMFNPGGSIKDRVALSIVEDAESRGALKRGMSVIEATSGNTGIGLALVCAAKGYGCTIVMPENMSDERKKLLKALNAELILTPAQEGIPGAVREAERLFRENPERFYPARQFSNPVNPETHYRHTAGEILEQLGRVPDAVVAGVGTGGTLMGLGRRFREVNGDCLIVAVEPEESAVISGGEAGSHRIQGIGAGFIPEILDTSMVDRTIRVSYEDAKRAANLLSRRFGIVAGVSSGANLFSALKVSKEMGEGAAVVTVFPDTGERYLSTDLFDRVEHGDKEG